MKHASRTIQLVQTHFFCPPRKENPEVCIKYPLSVGDNVPSWEHVPHPVLAARPIDECLRASFGSHHFSQGISGGWSRSGWYYSVPTNLSVFSPRSLPLHIYFISRLSRVRYPRRGEDFYWDPSGLCVGSVGELQLVRVFISSSWDCRQYCVSGGWIQIINTIFYETYVLYDDFYTKSFLWHDFFSCVLRVAFR